MAHDYRKATKHIMAVIRSCRTWEHLNIALLWAYKAVDKLPYSQKRRDTLIFKVSHTSGIVYRKIHWRRYI